MSLAQLVQTMDYEALGLSEDEMRAYRRWYTDLLLRKGNQAVRIDDTLTFLSNFMIEQQRTALMDALDNQIKTLDPVQFYAFIRLAGHVLTGEELRPECLFMAAQVPQPRSILSDKKKDKPENSKGGGLLANPFRKKEKLDLDSFTKFIMTGNRPGGESKKGKRVTFNEEPEVAEAAARSMDELMRQRGLLAPPVMYQQPQYNIPSVTVTEDEPEEDVEIDSSFQNVNIDSVLHNGVSNVADMNDFQAPNFSPSPSPSPQPGYPFQQQQQQSHSQSQSQPQVTQSHSQLHLPNSTEQREQLSRFVPLQPTPTGSVNSSTSSLNPLQQLTPQQQFLQAMSPHRGPSPNPLNNSAPALQPPSLSVESPSLPSPPKHLSPNPSSTNLHLPAPNLQVPSNQFASPQPQNSPPVALSQFQSQMQHMRPPPPPPPPSRLRALTTSSLPSIPPPPPQPRRNISGGGSYARPAPRQSSPQLTLPSASPQSFSSQLQHTPSPQYQEPQPQYAPQVQQFQNAMLPPPPPPPPPPRSRATSSPGMYSPQLQQFQQPLPQQFTGSPLANGGSQYPNGQLNQYGNGQYQANGQYMSQPQAQVHQQYNHSAPYHTSSAPDLLADLKALQDEVDRLRR